MKHKRNWIYLGGGLLLASTSTILGTLAWFVAFSPIWWVGLVAIPGIVSAKSGAVIFLGEPMRFERVPSPFDLEKVAGGGWTAKYHNEHEAKQDALEAEAMQMHQKKKKVAKVLLGCLIAVMMTLEAGALSYYYDKETAGGRAATEGAEILENALVKVGDTQELLKEHYGVLGSGNPVNQIKTVGSSVELAKETMDMATKAATMRVKASAEQGFFKSGASLFHVSEKVFALIVIMGMSLTFDAMYLGLFSLVKFDE